MDVQTRVSLIGLPYAYLKLTLHQVERYWPCCAYPTVPPYVMNTDFAQAFSFDFEGGNGPEARDILDGRHRGVAMAKRKAAFFVSSSYRRAHVWMTQGLCLQLLMLLRRFTFLNKLPIPIIQAQGAARAAIHVSLDRGFLNLGLR